MYRYYHPARPELRLGGVLHHISVKLFCFSNTCRLSLVLLLQYVHCGRPFVKRFAVRYRTVVCTVLSVTLVYYGQMVGWIKMPLRMEVGLGPGHIVLGGNQVPAPKRGTAPPICTDPPIFGPCMLWPNGWMDQHATWYGSRPRPRRHCVRWGPSYPKRGTAAPTFRPMSIVARLSPT